MPIIRILLTALTIISLSACATMRPDPPTVQLVGLEVTNLSLSHANVQASLRLTNPNATTLEVEDLEFSLYLNDIQIATGQTAKPFNIASGESGIAKLNLASSYFELIKLSSSLKDAKEVHFRIKGEVEVGGPGFLSVTIPIEREGTIPREGSLQQLFPK